MAGHLTLKIKMDTTKSQNIRLKYFGHLAEDLGKGYTTSAIPTGTKMTSPQIIDLNGVDVPCAAYFSGVEKDGLICYINDGDANAFARNQFIKRTLTA